MGLDVRAWLNQEIVDVVIGQTLSGPELLDATTDFRPLVEAAKGTTCRIHAALQSHDIFVSWCELIAEQRNGNGRVVGKINKRGVGC